MTKVLTNEYKDDERLPGDDFNVNEAPSQGVKVLTNTLKDDEILEQIDPRLKGISTQTYIPDSSGDLMSVATLMREVVLKAEATSISIDDLPDKRNFKIILRGFADALASNIQLSFNDDNLPANNYYLRQSEDYAAFGVTTNNNTIALLTANGTRDCHFIANISNEKNEVKEGQGHLVENDANSSQTKITTTLFGWNNTTDRIKKITLSRGNFQIGTRLSVSF